jgi:hypothetical protein
MVLRRFSIVRNAAIAQNASAERMTDRQLGASTAAGSAALFEKTAAAGLRPVGGMAGAAVMRGDYNFNQSMDDVDKLWNDTPIKDAALASRIIKLKQNAHLGVENSIGDLRVAQTDVLKNIYGGRPTEMGGLQSVEAMRDISPETNADALKALTNAIDSLTDLLSRN